MRIGISSKRESRFLLPEVEEGAKFMGRLLRILMIGFALMVVAGVLNAAVG